MNTGHLNGQTWLGVSVGKNYFLPAGRGNFAVVGRQKSLFLGALIGPKSLFFFTLIVCNFEFYAARCCNKAAEDTPRAHQHESSDTVRSRKARCQELPDNPETRDTYDK